MTRRARPTARAGPADGWTRLVGPLGPGASAAVLGSALAGGVAAGLGATGRVGPGRGLLDGLVAADLVGGLVTFQLPPTRRQYARSSPRARLTFVLLHLHPFALPLTRQGGWRRAVSRYAAAVAATGALEVLCARSASRRTVANIVATAAAVVDGATTRTGPRWFGPVYLAKLIGGHGGIPRAPLDVRARRGSSRRCSRWRRACCRR
ncbi:hypothetical protein [Actinomycetospora aeridis]|uniref:Uncharacterized protein n=1 Tax=Actinomycetospora aeridis TaxID=3129231 RepID=A0ABU8NCU9_9PSEU